jgi:hypothetical protein
VRFGRNAYVEADDDRGDAGTVLDRGVYSSGAVARVSARTRTLRSMS